MNNTDTTPINSAATLRVLVVDDHPLMLDALRLLIASLEMNIEIVTAFTAESALSKATELENLALILLDFSLPLLSGYSAIIAFKRLLPSIPVIMISGADEPLVMRKACRSGAIAYISKSASPDVMCSTIRKVLLGEIKADDSAFSIPCDEGLELKKPLTKRQMEVLMLLMKGYSNKDIAFRIGVTEITIKMHLSAIFRALGVSSRTQAMMEVQRLGMFPELGSMLAT